MSTNFTIGNVLNLGWKLFIKNGFVFLGLFIAYQIISRVISSLFDIGIDSVALTQAKSLDEISQIVMGGINSQFYISLLVSMILGACFSVIFVKVLLDAVDENELKFYFNLKKVVNLFFANLLCMLIVSLGVVAFILPGLYFFLRFQFYEYFIVDKNCNAIDALKESWRITGNQSLSLFGLFFVFIGICILGLLAFIVGIFAAIPLCYVLQMIAYRLLFAEKDIAGEGLYR